MKSILKILVVMSIIFPEIGFAQIFEHDTLYIHNAEGNLGGSPVNYLHNNHGEFKDFKLYYNVLESEEEWKFIYSDWCCDIQEEDITSSYSVPLEAGDSSLVKVGVFWNGKLTGYGVVELVYEDKNDATNQATAIFIIDLVANATAEITREELEVFPNPTSSNLWFHKNENCFNISIFDASGKLVLSQPCRESNEIFTSTLPAGLYFVNFEDDNQLVIGNASFVKE